jgi:hypothetical protein
VRRICRYFPLFLLLFCIQFAHAQSGFDLNIGFGAAQDKAHGPIDLTTIDLGPCATPGSPNCANPSSLSGFMLGFGGNLMLWKKFGVGADIKLQPNKPDYLVISQQSASAGTIGEKLQTRLTFYDFNGIFQPVNEKKVAVQLVGGIGGANIKFYDNQSSSSSILGNSNSTQFIQSANHFQVHGGVGVQIYLTDHVFVRPEFDLHYVPNFQQFGRNVVTSEMVWLGYSFGDRP